MAKFFNDTRLDAIISELNTKYSGKYKFSGKMVKTNFDNEYGINLSGAAYDENENAYRNIGWVGVKKDWFGFDWIVAPFKNATPKDNAILETIKESVRYKALAILKDYMLDKHFANETK